MLKKFLTFIENFKPIKKPNATPFSIRLFTRPYQWFLFFSLCIGIFGLNLWANYRDYQSYAQDKPITLYAQVQLQYQKTKNHRTYFVLKLEDKKGHTFYTTSHLDLKPLEYKNLRIYGKMAKCSFLEFLRSCYFHSFTLSLLPDESLKTPLRSWVNSQHQDENSAILYRALFFADNINLAWRQFSNVTGIAHIIAISGFHLGVLSLMVFSLAFLFYRPLQKRYFPYRNIYYDLGVVVLVFMFLYLLLLDFQPSFFRAFLMAFFGFIFYYSGIKLFSFENLILATSIGAALFPSFLWNIGFILSVFGVFYIILFIIHMPKIPLLGYFLVFDCAIFLLMGPVVHFYFPYFSPYQFISIPISMAFILFFPVVLGLHLIGLGGIFDSLYHWALSQKIDFIEFFTPLWLFISYTLASLLAIKIRALFFILIIFSGLFYVALCVQYSLAH